MDEKAKPLMDEAEVEPTPDGRSESLDLEEMVKSAESDDPIVEEDDSTDDEQDGDEDDATTQTEETVDDADDSEDEGHESKLSSILPEKNNLAGIAGFDLLFCILLGIGGLLILGTNGDRQKKFVEPHKARLAELRDIETPQARTEELAVRKMRNVAETAITRMSYLAVLGFIGTALGVIANLLMVNRRIEGLSLAWVTLALALGSIILMVTVGMAGAPPELAGPASAIFGVVIARICWNILYGITLARGAADFTAIAHYSRDQGGGPSRGVTLAPRKQKKLPRRKKETPSPIKGKKQKPSHGKKHKVASQGKRRRH